MPHDVDHEVKANLVREGDKISTQNGTEHYWGATINLVKRGTKYTEAYGPKLEDGKRQRYFRLPHDSTIWVTRVEPTEAERAEKERQWMLARASERLDAMEKAYPNAVDAMRKAFDAGSVPMSRDVDALYAGRRLSEHAAQLRRGIEVHPDKSLVELFQMLRDQLAARILDGHTIPTTSGGFTIINAVTQINHETDIKVIQYVNSHFLY